MEIEKILKVWVAWTNTDLTEGKGFRVPKAVCKEKATAIRLGKKGSVQGCDCSITQEIAVLLVNGQWLIPGEIIYPSKKDKLEQEKIDKKTAALKKAKDAGLTEEDIEAISA